MEMEKRIVLGLDVNFVTMPSGKSPLHFAVSRSDMTAVRILLDAHADVVALDAQLNTALHVAVAQPDVALTETLLLRSVSAVDAGL